MCVIRQQIFYLFLRHAKTVIQHGKPKSVFLLFCFYFNDAVPVLKFHAMIDRVFHKRLQHQLQTCIPQNLRRRVNGVGELILKTHLLDHQIVAHML